MVRFHTENIEGTECLDKSAEITNKTGMSFDQTMQILNTLGTWVAGIGTFAAAAIALWLARRVEKIKLDAHVGLRLITGGGITQEYLNISVTNHGERSVTIVSTGWRIGRGKNKRFAIQLLSQSSPHQYPKKIEYGETASFMVNFSESPGWMKDFSKRIILDQSIKTLRAQIHTSISYTMDVVPEKGFLNQLIDLNQLIET